MPLKIIKHCIYLLLLFVPVSHAQTVSLPSSFVEFLPGEAEWQGQLMTSISQYENADGVRLDLVAAIHIGDAGYYAELNEYFMGRDAVLYELVADENERPTPGSDIAGGSAIGIFQQLMAGFLQIEFQLNEIDYSPENFIHADLSPSELAEIMRSKNESFFTMFMSLAMAQMEAEQAAEPSDSSLSSLTITNILKALNSVDSAVALKYLFAAELARADNLLMSPEIEQQITIIGDRNKAALEVLTETLEDPDIETISVFFGAAHMPGLDRKITEELGFSLREQKWLTAWDIR